MHRLSSQLTLGLSLKDETTFTNFYSGRNAEIVAALKQTASGTGERVIYLCSGRGQGASHLLKAACHDAHSHNLSSVYLPLSQLISLSPDVLIGLESLKLVCIDEFQMLAGRSEWEEAIFHLYNRIYDAEGKIIIAADDLP